MMRGIGVFRIPQSPLCYTSPLQLPPLTSPPQVGRDNAQELFEKAREWFVNRPIAISRQIREMIAAAHRPPSVAQERGDTFLTGMESGEEEQDDGEWVETCNCVTV